MDSKPRDRRQFRLLRSPQVSYNQCDRFFLNYIKKNGIIMIMMNRAESVSKYRMARAAIDMGDFSVAELMALADVPEGTAAHFISTLTGNHLVQTVSLPSQ